MSISNNNGWKRFAVSAVLVVASFFLGHYTDVFRSTVRSEGNVESLIVQLARVDQSLGSLEKTIRELERTVSAGAADRAALRATMESVVRQIDKLEKKVDN